MSINVIKVMLLVVFHSFFLVVLVLVDFFTSILY